MDGKKVVILLSTYNGEKYLAEQLDSLINQTYKNLDILIRDDGSSDSTKEILSRYSKNNSNITVIEDKNIGVKKSFFQLLKLAQNKGDYYAFCDQDDVWLPEKIEKAIRSIEKNNVKGSCLYCSTLNLVNEDLSHIKQTMYQAPNKKNAMIQNIVTGCTAVINNDFLNNILTHKPNTDKLEMHDSWLYLVAAFLGTIIFDENSYILYRQHENNVVGMSGGKIEKIRHSFQGAIKEKQNKTHRKQLIEFFELYNSELTIEDKNCIELFLKNNGNFFSRVSIVNTLGIHKQETFKTWIYKIMYGLGYY